MAIIPKIIVPADTGPEKIMARQYAPYPKMVYLSNSPKDYQIINSPDEWPEGAKALWTDFDEETVTEAVTDAATAKAKAKTAEKEYRKGIMAYLDEHDVDYRKNIATDKLEALKTALDQHLQDQKNDNGA